MQITALGGDVERVLQLAHADSLGFKNALYIYQSKLNKLEISVIFRYGDSELMQSLIFLFGFDNSILIAF